jgi:pimeloyl-ACP methyl ester carboxylesterase
MSAPPSIPSRRCRRLRRLVVALVVLAAGFAVVPFLVPLPRRSARSPEDVAAALGWEGRLLDAGGVRVWVKEAGPLDGPAVVLVHGFGGSSWSWRDTLPALAAAGYRAVALDLANFGLSARSWERDTSHASQAGLVAAVMDHLGIARATLVGHSMGANVVAWFAARHPERLARVVLVDAATGPADPGSGVRRIGALTRVPSVLRIGRLVLRSLLDARRMGAILRSAYADPRRLTEAAVAGYVAPLQSADWELGLLAVVRDAGASHLGAPLAEVLRVPTLIIWGREDRWIRLASGEALRAALPDASWAIIDDAGHLPMEEQPAAFNETLLAWLASTR